MTNLEVDLDNRVLVPLINSGRTPPGRDVCAFECDGMINYTGQLTRLMTDIVARVPTLSFIDLRKTLVFARAGRTQAEGAYATCHCLSLPPSEPGYYFWRDRTSGNVTRRSEWFVTKSPLVTVGGTPIDYMISFTLPRFCDQMLSRTRKRVHYVGQPNWIAKLDTIVHELYHVDPSGPGIRRMEKEDGTDAANCHGDRFFEDVVAMVNAYLATSPDPETYDFLRYSFDELHARFGGIAGTTFRAFPSYPQRYEEVVDPQPPTPDLDCRIEPLKRVPVITRYTEDHLVLREFQPRSSRALFGKSAFVAA